MSLNYVVTYNNVTLNVTKVDSYSEEPVYSDDETDLLYIKVSLSVSGLINRDINGDNTNNADHLVYLRAALQEPRCPLSFKIDGVPVIEILANDVKNGPLPRGVRVESIHGATMRAVFSVDTYIKQCDLATGTLAVLSNRWTQQHTIDNEGYSTIVTAGRLTVRADANLNPDNLRNNIFPIKTIPNGFQREEQTYILSSDGLTLDWSVRDKEYLRPAVNGITQWSGTWEEESNSDSGIGALILGTITVTASADKKKSKDEILDFCIAVALSRMTSEDTVRAYKLMEGLDKNVIGLSVTLMTTSSKDVANLKITTRIGNPINPLDTTGATPTELGTRGTYLATLFCNAAETSCADKTNDPLTGSAVDAFPTGRNTKVYVRTGPSRSDANNSISGEHVQHPYILVQIESKNDEKQNIVQLPIANNGLQCQHVKLAGATTKKIVKFRMERLNANPQLPFVSDANHVLLRSEVVPCAPEVLPSGVDRIFSVSGTLTYGLITSAQLQVSGFSVPKSPVDSQSGFYAPPSVFDSSLAR